MLINVQNLREDYDYGTLDEAQVNADPLHQFSSWLQEAITQQLPEPTAMTLATVNADGQPSARVVLLKSVEEEGFVFYTNYESRKAQEMEANPQAALVFFWHAFQRQVRVEGRIARVSGDTSTAYFQSRPKGSQIGAVASPQSSIITDRLALAEEVAALEARYADQAFLPRPDYWGGYVLQPSLIEFWQGRRSRLHDRLQYVPDGAGAWKIVRLAP